MRCSSAAASRSIRSASACTHKPTRLIIACSVTTEMARNQSLPVHFALAGGGHRGLPFKSQALRLCLLFEAQALRLCLLLEAQALRLRREARRLRREARRLGPLLPPCALFCVPAVSSANSAISSACSVCGVGAPALPALRQGRQRRLVGFSLLVERASRSPKVRLCSQWHRRICRARSNVCPWPIQSLSMRASVRACV